MFALPKKRVVIIALVISLIFLFIYGYIEYSNYFPSTDDAYVNADSVNVATKVNGYIKKIYVSNNQLVNQGDLLLELDDTDFHNKLVQAESAYNAQIAMTQSIEKQIAVQNIAIQHDKEQTSFLTYRFNMYQKLYNAKTISEQEYRNVKNQYDGSLLGLAADQKKLEQYCKLHIYALNKEEQSKATVQMAQNYVNDTKYYSPITGFISELNTLTVGNYVNPSQFLFGIVSNNDLWIDANFKEDQLSRIKVGQKVKVKIDMYKENFSGIVTSISHVSGNLFSLLPAQNATGNWVKVVQRFTVRVKLFNPLHIPVLIGSSAHVVINTTGW